MQTLEAYNLGLALKLMVKKQERCQAEHMYLTNIDSRIELQLKMVKQHEQGGIFKEWTQGVSNSNNPFINTVFKLINNLTRKQKMISETFQRSLIKYF